MWLGLDVGVVNGLVDDKLLGVGLGMVLKLKVGEWGLGWA